MFNLKRSAITLSPIVVAALVAVVALSSTPSGAAALRLATGKLGVTALAAGGGGGGGGVDALTISPDATLVARLAVSVTVTYKCRPVFGPNTFVASGIPPPCDFGSAGPTVISIK